MAGMTQEAWVERYGKKIGKSPDEILSAIDLSTDKAKNTLSPAHVADILSCEPNHATHICAWWRKNVLRATGNGNGARAVVPKALSEFTEVTLMFQLYQRLVEKKDRLELELASVKLEITKYNGIASIVKSAREVVRQIKENEKVNT